MAKGDKENQDEGAEKAKPEAKSGGGGGLVKILIVFVLVLVLAGAGVTVYLLVFSGSNTPAQEQNVAEQPAQTAQTARPASGEPGPIIAYPPFLVNLSDPGGQRYLRITLSLELSKEKKFQAEVESKDPRIKDIIISILSSKTYDEISTTQGKIAMKQEILRRLNTIMSGGRVVDVYITEFVVQ